VTPIDDLLTNNDQYASGFDGPHLPVEPQRRMAVVACMDSRMDIFGMLGLANGEAHVIRNAGGVVTDDVVRSLAISQRYLATREIVLIHHTDCGMLKFSDDEFRRSMLEEVGVTPSWAVETFTDIEADVRQSIARIQASPFIPHKDYVRGFVYDVDTRLLNEVR
jgi:carbonic anhydrase